MGSACYVYNGAAWFTEHLDAIKFICKHFWSELFKKQIDNLKTNHKGTFVLQDNRFRWLSCMSLDPAAENGDVSPRKYYEPRLKTRQHRLICGSYKTLMKDSPRNGREPERLGAQFIKLSVKTRGFLLLLCRRDFTRFQNFFVAFKLTSVFGRKISIELVNS